MAHNLLPSRSWIFFLDMHLSHYTILSKSTANWSNFLIGSTTGCQFFEVVAQIFIAQSAGLLLCTTLQS